MRELDRAIAEIGAIREQIALGTRFQGLGPATFAATGALSLMAAAGQALWLPAPSRHPAVFLGIWVLVAAMSAGLIGFEMTVRSRRLHSDLADEMLCAAVGQFLPSAAAGGLMTVALIRFAPQCLWMAPALWQVSFGLGVFASCRFLPRAMPVVGVWYLASGLATLAFAQGPLAFTPWSMGIGFGVGQTLVALVLRFGGNTDA